MKKKFFALVVACCLVFFVAGANVGCSQLSDESEKVYDLIIFGGQSNMQGQTEINPADLPVEGAVEYQILTDSFVELQNPVGEDIGELLLASHLGRGSLVPYFAQEYIEKTNRGVVAVHVAKSATTISQWLKGNAEGNERYEKTVEKINGAKKKLSADRTKKLGKIYCVWLQGESDALARTTKENYADMLTKFKNDIKADVGIDKFLIIEVGYFSYIYGGNNALDEAIQSAQTELCKTDEDFVYLTDIAKELSLNSAYINPSAPGHFNNEAMRVIGKYAGGRAAVLSDDAALTSF